MPIVNRVADLLPDIISWRRDIHAHPELGFDVNRTAALVAERLREFGCDQVVMGVGKTGVVGVIRGKMAAHNNKGSVIGLRADMDALTIEEATDLPYSSKSKGLMHACGHDGHTAMLLGAARYLAETRNFAGTAVVIFEPAEEVGTGAQAMIEDGLMERFGIEEVYGMHNWPGLPIGVFGIRCGPMTAGTDGIEITVKGRGGHPGTPHQCVDAILVVSQLVVAIQQILAQNVDPLEPAGISFHELQSGSPQRIVPEAALLRGSMRTLSQEVREFLKKRIGEVVAGIALVTGAAIELVIESSDALTFNQTAQTEFALQAAKLVVGDHNIIEPPPVMGGEDFGYMAKERPGTYVFVGNGDSAGLHHANYNFDDEAISYGTSFWIKLVESRLAG
ncbi:amidohydrolase [Rhizobium jaguaris]|uniref:Amidohydrolase n=1 Tax=Rhizobium jaguaris TaxID=1312183 RepID=A0A387G9Q0_9HYPH|nr:amidohydrolase [Rhizobium jaguaris]AYG64106.1 amidohydrolase [Rhizobium jaguaris]